jgi:hypothetical protein
MYLPRQLIRLLLAFPCFIQNSTMISLSLMSLFLYPCQHPSTIHPLLITHTNASISTHLSSIINSTDAYISSKISIIRKLFASDTIFDRLLTCTFYSNKTFLHIQESLGDCSSPSILYLVQTYRCNLYLKNQIRPTMSIDF